MSAVALATPSTCAEICAPPFAISFPSSPMKDILPSSSPNCTRPLEEGSEDLDLMNLILGAAESAVNLYNPKVDELRLVPTC